MSRRATVAVWIACLAGGVGLGVLTDGGNGPASRRDRDEPAADEPTVLPAPLRPSRDGEASAGADAKPSSRSRAGTEREDGGGGPSSLPPTTIADARPESASRPGRGTDRLDAAEAEAIIESVLPGVVVPSPLDPPPGLPTTTSEPPGSSTTTSEPPPSTTSTTDGAGGTTLPGTPGG